MLQISSNILATEVNGTMTNQHRPLFFVVGAVSLKTIQTSVSRLMYNIIDNYIARPSCAHPIYSHEPSASVQPLNTVSNKQHSSQ